MGEAVERSIIVRCDVSRAFQIFTAQLDRWWPKTHSRSGDPATVVSVEPWPGGRLFERTPAGVEHLWGRVVAWEPPDRLTYDWYLGSGSERPSMVEVRFTALGEKQTRVDVIHRGPELIGELWARNSVIYDASWAQVLSAYEHFWVAEA